MTTRGLAALATGPAFALIVLAPAADWPRPGEPRPLAEQADPVVQRVDAGGFPLEERRVQGIPGMSEPERDGDRVAEVAAADGPLAAPGRPGCVSGPAKAYTSGDGGATAPVAVRQAGGRQIPVANAKGLTAALASARPGDTIELADGRYPGKFVLAKAGTAASPITVVGSCRAVLDGGTGGSGYTMHLDGADYARLVGFTVSGGDKAVMTDRTNRAVLSHLTVGNTGSEAVHFLNFSSDNVVQHSLVHDTGKTKPQFGEGVYFGSAKSNWASKSGGRPDLSNNNRALYNQFRSTTAENIDVKEETSGGVIAGNVFDGSAISGQNSADSVVDVKGVRYQVMNNRTSGRSSALKDLIQTHVITQPATSGCHNTFAGNTFIGGGFVGQAVAQDKKCGTNE
ncbi:hypothetical protein BKA01_001388 [Pseudonocardia eucalypti]|nr:hypothetical protein [Pseudonocardia eucalypti]